MLRLPTLLTFLLMLTACGAPDRLVTVPNVSSEVRVSSSFRSIEVLEVSLPTYAASEEVTVPDGDALVLSDVLWADDPTRAVTLSLTRNLSEITGARVAPDPWPFDAFAAARVDVRVERFLVEDGVLVLAGQYFVADLEGRGRDHAHLFSLTTPVSTEDAPSARSRLVADLAADIARTALR